jgi:AraC-like DNA-binding protein
MGRRVPLADRAERKQPTLANECFARLGLRYDIGDISYFNRAFRRRYALAPSDVRAQTEVL